MDCPVSTSPTGPREGELVPYSCPIVYCPPVTPPMGGKIKGNFTYSMCAKYIDDINIENKQFFNNTCETSYAICDSNCAALKDDVRLLGGEINNNYTKYYSTGCKQGDQTNFQNKSSIFSISSQFSTVVSANPYIKSSTSQNQATLLMPCLLILVLVINFIQRKI